MYFPLSIISFTLGILRNIYTPSELFRYRENKKLFSYRFKNFNVQLISRKKSDKCFDLRAHFTDFDVINDLRLLARNDMIFKDQTGKLEALKNREAELSRLLDEVRLQKRDTLRCCPLTVGIVGFGRFGQFIARTFCKHCRVIVTSRANKIKVSQNMNVTYFPLSRLCRFLNEKLDVIILSTSIVSFDGMVKTLAYHLKHYRHYNDGEKFPLIVDVLSVKEYPRQVMLENIPIQCDLLCTHPMFGPESGKNGWHGLNFVFERTRINGIEIGPNYLPYSHKSTGSEISDNITSDLRENINIVQRNSDSFVKSMDRMERFLSIWEEEGCCMVPLSCKKHDEYAANSQFITHLVGRILGNNELNLKPTPIDTQGFQSILKLVRSTTTDSFDLFYGLYKYNKNSWETIVKLRDSINTVVEHLKDMQKKDNILMNGPSSVYVENNI